MAIKLNKTGYNHAVSLIKAGKVDKDSSWSFTTEDENKILGDDNWSEYKKWFLAIDDEANEETKAYYKFPFGKNGKVYRRGVIAAKQRAAQQGYTEIVNAADALLQKIDGDKENKSRETPPIDTRFTRVFKLDARNGILDEENRVVELSFSSEEPVLRWFGKEVLLHESDAVDFSPLENVGAVLLNHNPDNIVAKPLRVWLDNETKRGKAIIQFGNTEAGKRAFEDVKEGLLRGVSVGYIVEKWRVLEENEEWERFVGPVDIATKWKVLEISLTPIPADASVGVGRTQNLKEERMEKERQEERKDMTTKASEKTTETIDIEALKREAEKAERERVLEIRSMCKKFNLDDFADELIDKGTPVEEARKLILDKLASEPDSKPVTTTPRVELGESEREKVRDAMIDGLLARVGLGDKPNQFTGMTLYELARKSLEVAHVQVAGDSMTIISRAITTTTSDFPIVLQNIANKAVLDGFTSEPETWKTWCDVGSVSDFNTHTLVAPGELGDIEHVPEGARYKHIDYAGEIQEQFKVEKYGGIFSLSREVIKNDDLGLLVSRARNIGITAQRKIADLVYSVLIDNPVMGDGNNLFSTAHKNVASTGSAITYDSLKAAINAMRAQKDARGKRRLNIKPQFVIVPASMQMDVEELLNMQYIDFQAGKPNVLRKYNLSIVGEGRLDDAGTAWFLAGPKGKTVTVFFLDGNQTPTIETRQGFDVDGIEFKVRIEAGAKALTWKALYKNPGA